MAHFQFNARGPAVARALAFLTWIVLSLSIGSSARADDATATGTLIITLNGPIMDGVPTDAYLTYFIRAVTSDGKHAVQLRYEDFSMEKSPNDLVASGGIGAVITKEIGAGDWNVTTYQIEAPGRLRWRPAKEFSIPFKIQPGRATYVGSFQPVGHMTTGAFGISVPGGARFVITDQSVRDIPIVRANNPKLGPVDVSVFDVDTLNNPLLSSHVGVTSEPNEDQYCRYMNLLGCVRP